MGNKHPAEGSVLILSKYSDCALSKTENDNITTKNNTSTRGSEGWTIKNIPNDETKQRMGFNHIIHNKQPSKLLSCSKNGNLHISEIKDSDDNCSSLWKIIQQKDSNNFEIISFYGFWLCINSNQSIKMLSKHELMNNDKQLWKLHYVSKQEMRQNEMSKHKVSKAAQKDKNPNNKSFDDAISDKEDGYDADSDDDKRNYAKYRATKNQQNGINESIKAMLLSLSQLSESVNSMRSDIDCLKNKMNEMEHTQQINQQRIENKLDQLFNRKTYFSRFKTGHQKTEKRKVRAIVRIRPFLGNTTHSELDSSVIPINDKQIGFRQQKYDEIIQQTFNFDHVYHVTDSQEHIFQHEVEQLMDHVFAGKKCTLFCYGPTGSGKTFTAFGSTDNPGILARAIGLALNLQFDKIRQHQKKNKKYECKLHLSSLEIYNERIYDLLSSEKSINIKQGLPLRQNGERIVVQGLSKKELCSMNQFFDLYNLAMKGRKTAFTALNAHSSRSHAIFTLSVQQRVQHKDDMNKVTVINGKIQICDLAGSENNKRTENKGERLTESKNINRSLLALGAVIDALQKRTKPPYRDSVLTRLLSDCLGGDSISTMVCCVNGNLADSSMTRRCLEFGSNTRKIENKVIAHIENQATNQESLSNHSLQQQKLRKKRKRKDVIYKNENAKKRTKISNKHKHKNKQQNNHLDGSLIINENVKNTQPKKLKYSIHATPSKFIANDAEQIEKHDQLAHDEVIKAIDALTKLGYANARRLEQVECKQKEEESVINICRNDKFGLPPKCTPSLSKKALAKDKIKRARKLEKKGMIKEALIEYKRAQQFFKEHKGIKKKIDHLTLELESPDVRLQLSFEDVSERDQTKKLIKRRKLRGKKKENLNELHQNNDSESGDDGDVNMKNIEKKSNVLQINSISIECSYTLDTNRMLTMLNTESIEILKTLKSVGPAKAKAIITERPFDNLGDVGRVNGFHTQKAWCNLVEKNKIAFAKMNE